MLRERERERAVSRWNHSNCSNSSDPNLKIDQKLKTLCAQHWFSILKHWANDQSECGTLKIMSPRTKVIINHMVAETFCLFSCFWFGFPTFFGHIFRKVAETVLLIVADPQAQGYRSSGRVAGTNPEPWTKRRHFFF